MMTKLLNVLSRLTGTLFGVLLGSHIFDSIVADGGPFMSLTRTLRGALDSLMLPLALNVDHTLHLVPGYSIVRETFLNTGVATLSQYPTMYLLVLVMLAIPVLAWLFGSPPDCGSSRPALPSDAKLAPTDKQPGADNATMPATVPTATNSHKRRLVMERINPWNK